MALAGRSDGRDWQTGRPAGAREVPTHPSELAKEQLQTGGMEGRRAGTDRLAGGGAGWNAGVKLAGGQTEMEWLVGVLAGGQAD